VLEWFLFKSVVEKEKDVGISLEGEKGEGKKGDGQELFS